MWWTFFALIAAGADPTPAERLARGEAAIESLDYEIAADELLQWSARAGPPRRRHPHALLDAADDLAELGGNGHVGRGAVSGSARSAGG